jgi:hypothetical protein
MSRWVRSAVTALAIGKAGVARLFVINCTALTLAAPLLLPVRIQGAEDNFRMTMTGCQADSASIQNDTCRFGGHGVFAKRAGAVCRLICAMPKTNSGDQWDGLQLFGKDPDGTGLNYRILARWKRSSLGSTSATTLCSVDSNRGPSVIGYAARGCAPFSSFIPDGRTWYWLEVFITRAAGATQEIEVLGYDIF